MNKTFLLIDYKGKFTIIFDKGKEDDFDVVVGEISKEQAILDAKWRIEVSEYYGIPAIITEDEDLLKAYD